MNLTQLFSWLQQLLPVQAIFNCILDTQPIFCNTSSTRKYSLEPAPFFLTAPANFVCCKRAIFNCGQGIHTANTSYWLRNRIIITKEIFPMGAVGGNLNNWGLYPSKAYIESILSVITQIRSDYDICLPWFLNSTRESKQCCYIWIIYSHALSFTIKTSHLMAGQF